MFSTTAFCLKIFVRLCARRRAFASAPPPGAMPAITRNGLPGYACAHEGGAVVTSAAAASVQILALKLVR